MSDTELLPKSEPVRRLEVFTGAGRRRAWTIEQKARIVAETDAGGESVSAVARRHGLTPQQLFAWRRDARLRAADAADGIAFAPVIVEAPSPCASTARPMAGSGAGDRDCHRGGDGAGVARRRSDDLADRAACAEGGVMIIPSGAVRVLMATRPVDFRKGMDGLAAVVRESLGADPYSGVVYVFRAKRADRVKLLLWDGTGLVLVAKRFEKGSFRWPRISDGVMRLTSSQLSALLEGLDWTRVRAVRVPAPQATL
jgi:transposase